jgi:hypothetical protein
MNYAQATPEPCGKRHGGWHTSSQNSALWSLLDRIIERNSAQRVLRCFKSSLTEVLKETFFNADSIENFEF